MVVSDYKMFPFSHVIEKMMESNKVSSRKKELGGKGRRGERGKCAQEGFKCFGSFRMEIPEQYSDRKEQLAAGNIGDRPSATTCSLPANGKYLYRVPLSP